MHSATCPIGSREMKLEVSDRPGAIQAAEPKSILDETDTRGSFVLAVTTTLKVWRGTRKLGDEKCVSG